MRRPARTATRTELPRAFLASVPTWLYEQDGEHIMSQIPHRLQQLQQNSTLAIGLLIQFPKRRKRLPEQGMSAIFILVRPTNLIPPDAPPIHILAAPMPSPFSPLHLGRLTLANRIVMSPMTRSRAYGPHFSPTADTALYYSQRATTGRSVQTAQLSDCRRPTHSTTSTRATTASRIRLCSAR